MAEVKIKNLRMQALIGIFDYEREKKQDIIINIQFTFDESAAAASDDINDTVNYKDLKDRIKSEVEKSKFFLLEKLNSFILDIIMEDERIIEASVEVDKPEVFDDAQSVSLKSSRYRAKKEKLGF